MIRLDKVCQTYGRGAGACVALREITIEIPVGAFSAVAGPSGSGKTTLLNIIAGLEKPDSGKVHVEGRDLGALNETELCDLRLRRIGFVFQDFNLVPVLSVRENVALPLLFRRECSSPDRCSRIAAMLERVGLAGKQERRPGELSGGERQRVAIARALAGDPAIVLADEPTANLDQDTGIAIIELMRSLNRERGTTFLYATHDPQLIRLADTVFHLRNSRLD